MTNILLNGCNGRMGQAITALAEQNESLNICAGADIYDVRKNSYPVYKNIADCQEKADVIIDFSNPEALSSILSYATSNRIPLVVATTGLSTQQHAQLREASETIPVFFSANMSLGINLLIELVQKAARVLEQNYDIEIIEKHHNQKLDAPSGTALAIADAINDVLLQKQEYVYDRHSKRKKRSKTEIGIHAVRGGTIVGEHQVIFAGADEIIEISHSAASRSILASGALRAAIYLKDMKPGMYSMKSLIEAE